MHLCIGGLIACIAVICRCKVLKAMQGLFLSQFGLPSLVPCIHNTLHTLRHLSSFNTHYSNLLSHGALATSPVLIHIRGSRHHSLPSLQAPVNPVTITDMRKYLSSRGVPFQDGYSCLCIASPLKASCGDRSGAADKRSFGLYIDKTTGSFLCMQTQVQGSWEELKEYVALLQRDGNTAILSPQQACENARSLDNRLEKEREAQEGQKIWMASKAFSDLLKEESEYVKAMFSMSKISSATLKKFCVKFYRPTQSLVFPWFSPHTLSLKGIKMVSVREDVGTNNLYTQLTLPRPARYHNLFGLSLIQQSDSQVVLTGHEVDTLAVSQATGIPSLTLPRGPSCLPPVLLPYLEQFSKVTLWLGKDPASWEASRDLSRKLGPSRCWLVRPGEHQPSPRDALASRVSLSGILRNAVPAEPQAVVSFRQLRQDVLGEMKNKDRLAGVRWSRFSQLNRILKGHRKGELTVLTGPTGSGKTTFISECALDLCSQGVGTLWGSFEISNVRLARVMLTQYTRSRLEDELERQPQLCHTWADRFQELPLYFMTFHGEHNIKIVLETMKHAVYLYDISHVVIDNLQFMMGQESLHVDKFALQDHIISAFRQFATSTSCHVTLIIHPRKEEEGSLQMASIFGSAKATQEADNVLILQDWTRVGGTGRRMLQVVKNRYDGEVGAFPLEFNKTTLSFSGPPAKNPQPPPKPQGKVRGESSKAVKKLLLLQTRSSLNRPNQIKV
ncbi:twinkle protein, mitochondrial-like isoform X1 [Clupea harengus]|uniref:Twinkle mtDNA helicase n=2 Tax=Clupea harengus TaxID=7950 RepID=A0A6P8GJU1_CLUHA|nr:twinkle protein, mitochondrial-like isoform X1 [Clupea harengus]